MHASWCSMSRRSAWICCTPQKFYDHAPQRIISTRSAPSSSTTHQVEEVENAAHRVIFHQPTAALPELLVEDLGSHYQQLTVAAEAAPTARALKPFYEARGVRTRGDAVRRPFRRQSCAVFGEPRTPSIADLFVAKMQGTPST